MNTKIVSERLGLIFGSIVFIFLLCCLVAMGALKHGDSVLPGELWNSFQIGLRILLSSLVGSLAVGAVSGFIVYLLARVSLWLISLLDPQERKRVT